MTLLGDPPPADSITSAAAAGQLREIEVLWPDHQGHARGKRIEAEGFVERATGPGFAFCNASLAWDVTGDVKDGLRVGSWDTGWPDLFAKPDLGSFRILPWRPHAGQVVADVVDHHGELMPTAPRTVLRRVLDRLAALGYEAEVGAELEFHLLGEDGRPLVDGVQAYSLQKLAELDPVIGTIQEGLRGFVPVESTETEYGDGQLEVNLRHGPALTAADDAVRFKYAVRELARRAGAGATFMAKPFGHLSGNSFHIHISLWRHGEPAFTPEDGAENPVMRHAIGGLLEHLPALALYGGPTVNSYKRFEVGSFAPTTASWGADNRTVAIRSLIESPEATRIELRTGAADCEAHWSIAAALAAVVAGIEGGSDPGVRGEGNLYERGAPLPRTLADAVQAARGDTVLTDILGGDAVHDFTALAQAEWDTFVTSVTDWDRERYLRSA